MTKRAVSPSTLRDRAETGDHSAVSEPVLQKAGVNGSPIVSSVRFSWR
jgi:hypothetical protein